MITAVLIVLIVWLALSALTAVVCSTVARGGLIEDRVRGFAPALAASLPSSVPPPRRPSEGMAESRE